MINDIFNALLELLYIFVATITYPLTLLDNVSLPNTIQTSLTTASGYYSAVNSFLPIDTMLQILGVSIAFELAYFAYKGIMWIIKKIPFIN